MNLQINDYVVYKSAGVCQVISEETQSPDGITEILYYKLKPLGDPNSTYYIPVSTADHKLRRLLSREEVLNLIDTMPRSADDESTILSENCRERREQYSKIMKGDDQKALVQMISSLYFRKLDTEASGKRLSSMDDTAMRNAESLMFQEFGVVLGMKPEEVRDFIARRVNAMQQ
ncbi:MAG: CarD family transcriptional regulator [Oscillospiraceae bacterium]|nr:CarD family transcriptional regulator [Oscillospiraceae bacterium]